MNTERFFFCRTARLSPGLSVLLLPSLILAHEPEVMNKTVVTGRSDSLVGFAESSSEGYVGSDHLEYRPLLRPGEVLETIPGLLATQHSGSGKANQYFARGFNLDHGTDFATSVDGVPVNLPTHAHGQGYTDLNFLIPELVETIHYRKGAYFADVGDFGAAGSAELVYVDRLDRSLIEATGGSFGYERFLAAGSPAVAGGQLLYAVEAAHDDGPWKIPQDFQKLNGVLRYTRHLENGSEFHLTASAYGGRWNSTDQIPERAIPSLNGGWLGAVDSSDGGDSHRFSINGEWERDSDSGHTAVQVYGVAYDLDLFSNFTYFLDDPVNGDQFEQQDRRGFGGLKAHHSWNYEFLGLESESTVGLQTRGDWIHNGINHTFGRQFLSVTRDDTVGQVSVSPYLEHKTKWNPWLRSTVGGRADVYHFDVTSNLPQNSGTVNRALVSPKAGLALGPWANTELYLNGGLGFHSNDGRGSTTRVSPTDPSVPLSPVDPLVRTSGAEVGIRTTAVSGLQSTLSLWWLDLDSELVFSGDAGDTEVSRPSRRYGVEWANYYTPNAWLTFDLDFSGSHARFRTWDPSGQFVPGSIETVVASGISIHDPNPDRGFFASLRVRYFGPRALVEDDSARSRETLLLNAEAGYRFNRTWTLSVAVFNLLNRHDADIAYWYASRLPAEVTSGVADLHLHPVEPIGIRATLSARF